MDKKSYVLKVLDLVKDTMPLARWLIVLIQENGVDEHLVDTLIDAFNQSLKETKDEELKNKLAKWKAFLEEMKRMEIESKKRDEEDIKHLDELLSNI